jgi:hypothetical protein
MVLEKERQLRELNEVLANERQEREFAGWELVEYWKLELGYTKAEDLSSIAKSDWRWLFSALEWCPREQVRNFMDLALARGYTRNLKYVAACCRNWRYESAANKDVPLE